MANIEIYTKSYCPYCHKAKALLDQKGVTYTEINVEDPELQQKMAVRANGHSTVPQIFINDERIGGCDDLYALEHSNQLDNKLKS